MYLIFDAIDNGDDTGTWEAMASVRAHEVAAVLTEAQTVLAQADARAPGPRGALDDGGAWDADLQQRKDGEWVEITLTLTGPWHWGEALLAGRCTHDQ
ncbi:MAG: hypothetical protein KF871_17140 [Hydrogenophaga sp.]|uniref:hypothetical protein n=1 Tax=Hydrogenophaga sp. TaxID=1904254 RepID=UPI001DFF7FE2|nr:hypothetical protein [Hydrogenophaga sp.]MBX3611623.1 hypothetical protein [Hydrogenophaga sp.]